MSKDERRAESPPLMRLKGKEVVWCRMILPQFDFRLDRPVDAVCKEACLKKKPIYTVNYISLLLYQPYSRPYKCNNGLIRKLSRGTSQTSGEK